MNRQHVQIESVNTGDGVRWRVCFGKRTVTFESEHAARAFAAQLHMRLKNEKPALVPRPDEPPAT